MPRNKGQANRVKDNMKPASSAQAAQQLEASGPFLGFAGLMSEVGLAAFGQGPEEVEATLDSDLRLVLKKLSKKDATTRLKAVQELGGLCGEKEGAVLTAFLPYWPRLYGKLALDSDRRVRENTQHTHLALCKGVGKALGPHLKTLMGPWLLAQVDWHPPAASAATAAFTGVFPPAKQEQVLNFCREEAFTYLHDTALNSTPTSISDAQSSESEEGASRHARLVSGALTALARLLSPALLSRVSALLGNPAFWKLAKSETPQVKSAVYGLLSGVCQKLPEVASEHVAKLCPCVLHSLASTDPVIVTNLWQAALNVVHSVQGWENHVSVRKGMLPGLFSVLREGGGGCALTVLPNVLPLVASLPASVVGDEQEFFARLLDSVRTGLEAERVSRSASECGAVVTCYLELCRYVMLRPSAPPALRHAVVDTQLECTLEASMSEGGGGLYVSPLYQQTAELLRFLLSNSEEDSSQAETCSDVYRRLWGAVARIISAALVSSEPQISRKAVAFLKTLAGGKTVNKSRGVRFSEEGKRETVEQKRDATLVETSEGYELFRESCEALLHADTIATLTLLRELLETYVSPAVLKGLVPEHSEESSFHAYLLTLVLAGEGEGREEGREEVLLEIAVVCLAALEDRLAVLDTYCQAVSPPAFVHLLSLAIRHSATLGLSRWLRGEAVSLRTLSYVSELCRNMTSPDWQPSQAPDDEKAVLSVLLRFDRDDEPVLGSSVVTQMLETLGEHLPHDVTQEGCVTQIASPYVRIVAELAEKLFTDVPRCVSMKAAQDLLVSLFCLHLSSASLAPSQGDVTAVCRAWRAGVGAVGAHQGALVLEGGTLDRLVTHLLAAVTQPRCSLPSLRELTSAGEMLVGSVVGRVPPGSCRGAIRHVLLSALTAATSPHVALLLASSHWCWRGLVSGELLCVEKPPLADEAASEAMITLANTACFNAALALQAVKKVEDGSEKSEGEDAGEDAESDTEGGEGPDWLHLYLDLLLAHTLLSQMSRDDCQLGRLSELQTSVLDRVGDRSTIIDTLLERAWEEGGGAWSVALYQHVTSRAAGPEKQALTRLEDATARAAASNPDQLPALYAIMTHLPAHQLVDIVSILSALVTSLPVDSIEDVAGAARCLRGVSEALRYLEGSVEDTRDAVTALLDTVIAWRDNPAFLFATDVREARWGAVEWCVSVMHVCRAVVRHAPTFLSPQHWDFILCSLVSWSQSVSESAGGWGADPPCQVLLAALSSLLAALAVFMRCGRPTVTSGPGEEGPSQLGVEWREFFSEGAFSPLVAPALKALEKLLGADGVDVLDGSSSALQEALGALCGALGEWPPHKALEHSLPGRLTGEDAAGPLPDAVKTLLNHLCPHLRSPLPAAQLATHNTLARVLGELGDHYKDIQPDPETEELIIAPPAGLVKVLVESGAEVSSAVVRGAQESAQTAREERSYLLSWRLVLHLFRALPPEQKAGLSAWLGRGDQVGRVLHHLFVLMPGNPTSRADRADLFAHPPSYTPIGEGSPPSSAHLACGLYREVLETLPALARQWWTGLDRATAAETERYTSRYVSPLLIRDELERVNKQAGVPDLTVKPRPGASDILVTYAAIEDASLELSIRLDTAHPLRPMTVETLRSVGVGKDKWKTWSLQLVTYLVHQNGPVMEGLALWKRNVDKRFEGIEECMICFSVLHGSNYQLPRLTCRTCKKKFHSYCLYRWFSTSNTSKCPLCRDLF